MINELGDWKLYGPGAGLQLVYQGKGHHGIETGFYIKNNAQYHLASNGAPEFYVAKFNEIVLQLPVFYRYHSKAINFTVGAVGNFMINHADLEEKILPGMSKSYFHKFEPAASLGISKSFYLGKKWIFEPELRASAFVPDGGGGLALNVAFRRKIF